MAVLSTRSGLLALASSKTDRTTGKLIWFCSIEPTPRREPSLTRFRRSKHRPKISLTSLQAATDGVPQAFQDALASALDRLKQASSVKDATGTLQAANDLSAAVIDIFSVYHPPVPTDLGRLDVLER